MNLQREKRVPDVTHQAECALPGKKTWMLLFRNEGLGLAQGWVLVCQKGRRHGEESPREFVLLPLQLLGNEKG